jgi:hypothetical protein
VDKPLEIWFQDEARVGQQGTLSYVWAERGSRPAVKRDNRHDSAWLFGAVCPERAVGAAVVMPWVSSEAMGLHLTEIGKAVAHGAHCGGRRNFCVGGHTVALEGRRDVWRFGTS